MNIVSKLTLRYLKQNRVRTILTIIGITISVATVTALGLILLSFIKNLKEDYISGEGAYDFRIVNSDPKTDAKVNNIRHVKTSYKLKKESIARIENRDDNLDLNYFIGLEILEASDSFFDEFVSEKFLVEGRMPRNDTEILVPYDMKYMGIGFENLGNTIYVGITKSLEGEYSFSKPFSINYLRRMKGDKLLTQTEYMQIINLIYDSMDNSFSIEGERNEEINKRELEENLKKFYVSENDLRNLVNEFSVTKPYTIVGYHYGNSENITNDEEFIPYGHHKSLKKSNEYLQDTKNLIFSGQLYTLSNETSENYNLYGIFSNYDNIESYESEIYKILEESDRVNDFWINTGLIEFKSLLKSNIGLYTMSIVAILDIVILISIVVFVYNIFTSIYAERLRDLGLLKVVGLTNKQLLKMILLDSLVYFIIAVPLGYVFGNIAMKLVFSFVNRTIVEISVISPYTMSISFVYIIPLISAIFGFLIIFGSNIMSAIFVFKKTPIDALKANNYVKSNYRPKNRRLLQKILGYDRFIASRNIDRNKKRFVMHIFSITMSITILTVVSNTSIFIKQEFYDEIEKKEVSYGSVITLDKYADQLKSDFYELNGINVESTQEIHWLNLIQKENLTEEAIKSENIIPEIQVVTMNSLDFEETFGNVNNNYFSSNYDEHKNGEKYEITLFTLESKLLDDGYEIFPKANQDAEINLNVIKKKLTELESLDTDGYSNVLFMTEANYEKLLENTEIKELESRTRILIDRNDYNYRIGYELNAILKKYPTTGIELKITPIFKIIELFVYGFIFLVMSIAALNIMNTSYTNTYTRREELALLKSIGIEDKRLKKILLYEVMIVAGFAILISLILSIALSYLLYILTGGWLIITGDIQTYIVPLIAWALASVFSLLLIYIFVSISYNRMMKDNITEVLK